MCHSAHSHGSPSESLHHNGKPRAGATNCQGMVWLRAVGDLGLDAGVMVAPAAWNSVYPRFLEEDGRGAPTSDVVGGWRESGLRCMHDPCRSRAMSKAGRAWMGDVDHIVMVVRA